MIIDRVKTVYGTSNDGNTVGNFFENAEIAAEIIKLDLKLIKNLSLILRTLLCHHKINIVTFLELFNETRDIYNKNYSWYYMPLTVHKILDHGIEIIQHFSLPIGFLSADALEVSRVTNCPFLRGVLKSNKRSRELILFNSDVYLLNKLQELIYALQNKVKDNIGIQN